ncbi:MAG: hypothetical protein ACXW3S_10275, partial [Rhodoplanes sp.]
EQRQAVPEDMLSATLVRGGCDHPARPVQSRERRRRDRQSSAAEKIASRKGHGASPTWQLRTVETDYVRFGM